MKRYFSLNTAIIITSTAIGFLLGVLGNIVFDWAKAIWGLTGLSILIVILLVGLVGLLMWLLSKRHTHVILRQAVKLRTSDERKRNAKRGLISFVSIPPKPKIEGDALSKAIEAQDYAAVYDFNDPKFNWQPLIAGILAHKPKLEKLWLIGTESDDASTPAKGSAYVLPLLKKYLTEEKQIPLDIFVDTSEMKLLVTEDDASSVQAAYDLIQAIYKSAQKPPYKFAESDLAVDINGTPRSLALGATLACLDSQRVIQLDGYGTAIVPTLFAFEALLSQD